LYGFDASEFFNVLFYTVAVLVYNGIGGVMVCLLTLCTLDHVFEPLPCQPKIKKLLQWVLLKCARECPGTPGSARDLERPLEPYIAHVCEGSGQEIKMQPGTRHEVD
jgi:hypothetical protein